jgi:hypothetical protein
MNTHVIKKDSWSYKTIQRYGCWFNDAKSLCEYRTRLGLALLTLVLCWGALGVFLSTTFVYIVCLLELSSVSDVTIAIKDLMLNPPNFITTIVMNLLVLGQLLWLILFGGIAATLTALTIVHVLPIPFKLFKLNRSLIYKIYVDWKNKVCTPVSFE